MLSLAIEGKIDQILVTELSRWGRNTEDLMKSLNELFACNVSLHALNGPQLDISSSHGKLLTTVLSAISEFERSLIKERVKSGMAAAKAKGKVFGRKKGYFLKSGALAQDVLNDLNKGVPMRKIAEVYNISKTTVCEIKKRFSTEMWIT